MTRAEFMPADTKWHDESATSGCPKWCENWDEHIGKRGGVTHRKPLAGPHPAVDLIRVDTPCDEHGYYTEGTPELALTLEDGSCEMTSKQARTLAVILMQCADALDEIPARLDF